MPAMTTRRKLVLAEIAAIVFAIDLVVALLLGAPAWVSIVFAVATVDAAAYAGWQLRAMRHDASARGRATTAAA